MKNNFLLPFSFLAKMPSSYFMMLYDVFRTLASMMHSVDFWTREQILCVSKVDETKAMCARKAFCLPLCLPKQSKVEKSNLTLPHPHPSSPTVRCHNSTFQGKDVGHAICQGQLCCPRAVTSGGRFLSPRKPHFTLR